MKRERDALLFDLDNALCAPSGFVPAMERDSLLEQIQHLESESLALKEDNAQLMAAKGAKRPERLAIILKAYLNAVREKLEAVQAELDVVTCSEATLRE